MKILNPKKYKLNDIYREAIGFRENYNIINDNFPINDINKMDLLTPMITSIIFSCELYMKILLIYYEIKIENIHSLSSLFNKLPKSLKNEMENDFNATCTNKSYFKKALDESSNSYVKFRYHFAYDEDMTIHMKFFEVFNDILFKKVKFIVFKELD